MKKYRKKPVVIEAIQWTGENTKDIFAFGGDVDFWREPNPNHNVVTFVIPTLEGNMRCMVGDWIIKRVKGEFYPCKPDIFEQTYELVK